MRMNYKSGLKSKTEPEGIVGNIELLSAPKQHRNHRSMKKRRYIITLFALLILMTACDEIIEFKGIESEPKIVIYSMFESNRDITLTLARSYAVFDQPLTPTQITNAVVKLYTDGEYTATLSYVPETTPVYDYGPPPIATYIAAGVKPEQGRLYRIEAEVPGLPSVWAEVSLPEPVPIIRIDTTMEVSFYQDSWTSYNHYRIKAKVRFSDPADRDNYYRITANSIRGRYNGPKDIPYDQEEPVSIHYDYIGYAAHNDPIINPQREEDLFGEQTENRYALFSDELISGRDYDLKLDLYFAGLDTTYYEFVHFDVELQSVSKDLYLYLISSTAHERSKDNPLAEPVIVYSNVNNGLGVVGAVSSSRAKIKYGQYPVDGVKYENPTGYQ